jgi:hypothetical protein
MIEHSSRTPLPAPCTSPVDGIQVSVSIRCCGVGVLTCARVRCGVALAAPLTDARHALPGRTKLSSKLKISRKLECRNLKGVAYGQIDPSGCVAGGLRELRAGRQALAATSRRCCCLAEPNGRLSDQARTDPDSN